MAFAANAGAATVTATEGPVFKAPEQRYAMATVEGQANEANRLSITLAGEPGRYVLRVRDEAEPILAGSGCEGGGAAGAVVSCAVSVQPGSVTVVLGNEGAQVDAGSFPGAVFVWAGSGDDSVVTGSGPDAFFPTRCGPNTLPVLNCDPELGDDDTGIDRVSTGAGEDWVELGNGRSEVRTGPDDDWVIATPTPNGHDLIDLEAGEADVADYRLRREALTYVADDLANDGAAGEGDAVLGAEFFAAGAGDDLLVGGGAADYLFGGGGADLLIGKGGADVLVGEHGEEDNLGFVAGVDVTRFRASYPVPLPLEFRVGGDTARGGGGNDRLYLDGGNDRGFGGPGADRIWGDAGRDRLLGQRGRNRLDGGTERDRCRGGSRRSVVLRCEGSRSR
ncbi:MAG TPA: calcium-binding protein [Solirubrobacterales bacterium]|nr:calcium-binding protein [Solirubrobacterales bacterium]